jgi:hypothetical protein
MTKLLTVLALTSCTIVATPEPPECTDGKCDGGGVSQTCDDPHYDDGKCDLSLSCAVPDIDCYRTFASDTEAGTWWAATEQTALGENYPIVSETDPRFLRMRAALDKGWDAFKQHRPVGKLGDLRPALVLVDQPLEHGAFVISDRAAGNQPFVVMVETAAIAGNVDDASILSVMMHELQHAVGLHRLGDVGTNLRKFYIAPEGSEPMGRDQTEDADAKTVGLAWMDAAAQVGPYSQVELGGFPMAGIFGEMLANVVAGAKQAHPTECADSVAQLNQIATALSGAEDLIDQSLPADLGGVDTAVADALTALRDDCLPNFQPGVIEVGAAMLMMTPAEYEAQLAPRDVALVKNKTFVDGLVAVVEDRRETMRTAEELFADAAPWTQLRYFSVEEDADDVSGIVMNAAGYDPTSIGKFMARVLLMPDALSECQATSLPGYGVDLNDDHHATCWRIGHNQRQAAGFMRSKPVSHAPLGTLRRPGKFPAPFDPKSQIAN